MRPISRKRQRRDRVYADRRADAHERANGHCEAWVAQGCRGRAELVHHIAGRGGDDPHRLDNLLAVCDPCHRHIHANPAESYAQGFMVRRNGVQHG